VAVSAVLVRLRGNGGGVETFRLRLRRHRGCIVRLRRLDFLALPILLVAIALLAALAELVALAVLAVAVVVAAVALMTVAVATLAPAVIAFAAVLAVQRDFRR